VLIALHRLHNRCKSQLRTWSYLFYEVSVPHKLERNNMCHYFSLAKDYVVLWDSERWDYIVPEVGWWNFGNPRNHKISLAMICVMRYFQIYFLSSVTCTGKCRKCMQFYNTGHSMSVRYIGSGRRSFVHLLEIKVVCTYLIESLVFVSLF
jgi:hypothetical protein